MSDAIGTTPEELGLPQAFPAPQRRDWRIGMIGFGRIARYAHVPAYRRAGWQIAAVADPDPAARKSAADEFGIKTLYEDYGDLIADDRVEIVDLLTHPTIREEVILAAAEAGKPVITEKPLGPDLETCIRMVQVADGAGISFAVHQNYRWRPANFLAYQAVQRGLIGDPFFIGFEVLGIQDVELAQHPEDKSMAYLGIRFSRVPHVMLSEEFPLRHLEGLMPRSLDQERFEPHFIGPGELFEGALVMRVAAGSPAAKGGLQPGDVIISINNKPVSDMDSVSEAIAEFQPGDLVTVTVHSPIEQDAADPETIEITLSERPDGSGKAYLGVTIGGVRFGSYEGDPGSRKRIPFWQQFDFDEYPRRRGGSNDRRFGWLPDWDLDMDFEMPFDLDSLRERFREPRLFQFDWTPSQEAGAESSGSASASA